jgi:two-component system copper resistance phosphate regulon response regulator CusR
MKVLFIEDEEKMARAITSGLQDAGIEVDCAYDGETGLHAIKSHEYDVIITDIIMPGMNGLELLRKIRKLEIRTPVLLLSALVGTETKVEGLDIGADDYLVKPFEFDELIARIRALARRANMLEYPLEKLEFSGIVLDLQTKTCTRDGLPIELTPKEYALIEYLIRKKERVVSKREIAQEVWDIHFESSTNVVEVYVNYLRNKIDKPFDNKLIHTVFGAGYILKRS